MTDSIKAKLREIVTEDQGKPASPVTINMEIDGEPFVYVVPEEDVLGDVVIATEQREVDGKAETKTYTHLTASPIVFPEKRGGGVRKLDVEISSTQDDDELLLHKLYQAVREKDV